MENTADINHILDIRAYPQQPSPPSSKVLFREDSYKHENSLQDLLNMAQLQPPEVLLLAFCAVIATLYILSGMCCRSKTSLADIDSIANSFK
jgi:hypothetical protein